MGKARKNRWMVGVALLCLFVAALVPGRIGISGLPLVKIIIGIAAFVSLSAFFFLENRGSKARGLRKKEQMPRPNFLDRM